MRGWYFESYRHSLAARGIRTSFMSPYYRYMVNQGIRLPRKPSKKELVDAEIDYLKTALKEDILKELPEPRRMELTDKLNELQEVREHLKPGRHGGPLVSDFKRDLMRKHTLQVLSDERAQERVLSRIDNLILEAASGGVSGDLFTPEVLGKISSGRSVNPLDLAAKKPFFDPMRPTDTSSLPSGSGFIVEKKFDGTRAMLDVNKSKARVINRRQVDKTEQFPELADVGKDLNFKKSVKLDGEVVVLKAGAESFRELSSRNHLKAKADIEKAIKQNPVTYMAFDILEKDGSASQNLPLIERKELLRRTIPNDSGVIKKMPFTGNLELGVRTARAKNSEGVVFKRKDSPYVHGTSSDWQKLKFKKENDYAVIGYTDGAGKRYGKIGALVLAHNGHGLKYAGDIGTGFTDAELAVVTRKVQSLKVGKKPESYPKLPSEHKIHFIRPKLVARVQYGRMGSQGRIKEGVFIAFRQDLTPKETHK
jgi:DNA ligase D-like protein (predicted ligase)